MNNFFISYQNIEKYYWNGECFVNDCTKAKFYDRVKANQIIDRWRLTGAKIEQRDF